MVSKTFDKLTGLIKDDNFRKVVSPILLTVISLFLATKRDINTLKISSKEHSERLNRNEDGIKQSRKLTEDLIKLTKEQILVQAEKKDIELNSKIDKLLENKELFELKIDSKIAAHSKEEKMFNVIFGVDIATLAVSANIYLTM